MPKYFVGMELWNSTKCVTQPTFGGVAPVASH